MVRRNPLFCDRGATSLALVLGIVGMIITFGFAAYWLGRDESKLSVQNRAGNDAYFVADSGRRVGERLFQEYLLGSIKKNLKDNITKVMDIAASNDSAKFLELGGLTVRKQWMCTKCGWSVIASSPGQVAPTSCADTTCSGGQIVEQSAGVYRINLDGDINKNFLQEDTGAEIWNIVEGTKADRAFDAQLVVEKYDDAAVQTTKYWAFPLRFRFVVKGRAPLSNGQYSHQTIIGRGQVTLYVNKDANKGPSDYLEFTLGYKDCGKYGEPSMKPRDNYQGSVFTGGYYIFYGNPSGTQFTSGVYTHQTDAYFYTGYGAGGASNREFYPQDAKKPRDYIVYPNFVQGYYRGIPTPAFAYESPHFAVDVLGGSPEPAETSEENIYVPTAGVGLVKGGIYVVGNCGIELKFTAGVKKQEYIFTHYDSSGAVSGTSTVVADYSTLINPNGQTKITRRGGSEITYGGIPDVDPVKAGPQTLIYVRGQVKSLKGGLALDTQLSIKAMGLPDAARKTAAGVIIDNRDIIITGNLVYESRPSTANPNPPNILGLIAGRGDIAVSTSLSDITIHALILTTQGEFFNADGTSGPMKGQLKLFGSVAGQAAGYIGSQTAGFAKYYEFDTRGAFSPPPGFPLNESQYTVIMERPDTGQTTWRVIWADENL